MTANTITVSIQDLHEPEGATREEKEASLAARFDQLTTFFISNGIDVNADSLSVSGRTIEATMPEDKFKAMQAQLAPAGFVLRHDNMLNAAAGLVTVSIHDLHEPQGATREEKKASLAERFNKLTTFLISNGVDADPDSLSVSAREIEATMPQDKFRTVQAQLAPAGFVLRYAPARNAAAKPA